MIEDNICYDADRQAFHQHYGRENVVRNNVFAFGTESTACYSRCDDHSGITFTNNLFVTDGKAIYSAGYNLRLTEHRFRSDLNLFFDVQGRPVYHLDQGNKKLSLAAWRKLGQDVHSIVADPKFRNVAGRDFRLKAGSPALRIGFRPIDLSDVGPRPASKRG